MKSPTTIKLKALFLLVSFSLNSVVGFACSLGVDMGFNSGHHQHEDEENHKHGGHAKDHSHGKEDSHKHGHEGEENHQHDGYTNEQRHHDKESPKHSHQGNSKDAEANTAFYNAPADDNCCNDFVVGYQNLDKQIVEKSNLAKQYSDHSFVLYTNTTLTKQVYTKPVRIPPKILDHSPPDIRIYIQSFLI